jgi:hypothetical protein
MNILIELGEMYRINVINFYEYNLELFNIQNYFKSEYILILKIFNYFLIV